MNSRNLIYIFGLVVFILVPGSSVALAATMIIKKTIGSALPKTQPCPPCPEDSAKKNLRFLKDLKDFIQIERKEEYERQPTQKIS